MKKLPTYTIDRSAHGVKHVRRKAGLTQADVATMLDLSGASRVAEYEAGRRQIDMLRFEWLLLLTDQHPAYRLARRR